MRDSEYKPPIMKQTYTCLTLLLTILCLNSHAQIQIQNSGLENWSGNNLQRPDYWTTTEQALGLKKNKYTFRETLPENMHSGLNSVKLYSDTTSFPPNEPVGLVVIPGMIAYGKASYVNNKLVTSGLPVNGRPISLSMYVRLNQPVTDTAIFRLLLTRWNAITRQEDTLAYERKNIFPDSTIMSQFSYFIDSIQYRADGIADTARIIITGGRRGNVQTQGNSMWVDDIAFKYPNDEIVHTNIDDEVFLFPNPAIDIIYIKAKASMYGYTVVFQDVTGLLAKQVMINSEATSIDVSDMREGSYNYAILDPQQRKVHQGNINIVRDR
jgi:hypothetical protein